LQGHYFTAVNEACKAYNISVKKAVAIQKDGRDLMLSAFGKDKSLRSVPGDTESEGNQVFVRRFDTRLQEPNFSRDSEIVGD
jgi:hypothetical protein